MERRVGTRSAEWALPSGKSVVIVRALGRYHSGNGSGCGLQNTCLKVGGTGM